MVRRGPLFHRRVPWAGLVLATSLASCTQKVVLDDVFDAGADAPTDVGADASVPRDSLPPFAFDAGCTLKPLVFHPQPARFLIELDRSTAMQAGFSNMTKAGAVQLVLGNEINNYAKRIWFGLEQFPSQGGPGGQCGSAGCCPGPVAPEPAYDNAFPMNAAIGCSDFRGGGCMTGNSNSPSHAALKEALDYFSSNSSTTRLYDPDQYVLLITASEPTCAQDTTNPCEAAGKAVRDLNNSEVNVVVLFLGDSAQAGCLSATQIGKAKLVIASNLLDLTKAVDQLFLAAARSACTLTTDLAPPADAKLQISIGPTPVRADEWSFANGPHTAITLTGNACDRLLESPTDKAFVAYSVCSD